jgi:hypothetical protein
VKFILTFIKVFNTSYCGIGCQIITILLLFSSLFQCENTLRIGKVIIDYVCMPFAVLFETQSIFVKLFLTRETLELLELLGARVQ